MNRTRNAMIGVTASRLLGAPFASGALIRFRNPLSCFLAALLLSICAPQAIAQSIFAPETGAGRSKAPPPASREDNLPLPLRIEWRTVDRTVGDCSDPVWGCAKFFVRYPMVPMAEPGTGGEEVNRLAEEWALSPWQKTGPRLHSPESGAKSFFTSYRRYRSGNPDKPQKWGIQREVSVVYATPRLLSLRYEARSNIGDKTLEDGTLLATVDLHTGRRLSLVDLVPPEGAERIRTIAEKEFRAARRLAAGDRLPSYIFLEGAKFTLPENFLVDHRGLTFRYNVNRAVGSHEGPEELFLSYIRLAGILRADGPLAGLAR